MSTVKLTNDVTIDSSSLKAFPDFTNILKDVTIGKGQTGETTVEYDCVLRMLSTKAHCSLYINGIHFGTNATGSGGTTSGDQMLYHCIPLKKGDVIKKYSYYGLTNENDSSVRYVLLGTK